MTAKIVDIRLLLLVAATLVYATFSDPTPDTISWAELAIGASLVVLVGIGRGLGIVSGARLVLAEQSQITQVRNLAFIWLLLVPMAVGAFRSASANELVRDLIPMLFLFLPLLVGERLESADRRSASTWLVWTAVASGVILATRHLFVTQSSLVQIGEGFYSEHSLYLSTDSFVHFAAALLLIMGFRQLVRFRAKSAVIGVAMIAGGLFCLGVLALKGHRGPVVLVLAALFAYILTAPGLGGRIRIRLLIAGSISLGIMWVAYGETLIRLADLFLAKHEAVGISNRDAEFLAIVDIVFRDTFTGLFGLGFGSVYESPAASATVNFAHWIGGYVLLKAGLVGALLVTAYFLTFWRPFVSLVRAHSVLAFAVAGPLLVGVTISGSYRFLSYGILLSILHMAGTAEPPDERQVDV